MSRLMYVCVLVLTNSSFKTNLQYEKVSLQYARIYTQNLI